MAAFTDYKALDFSGLDAGIGRIAGRFKENRENEAILKYLESQSGKKQEGTSLANLDADYGKPETVAKPAPMQNSPLPKLGVQTAETEEDTRRLEGQMAAGQGAFARPPPQQGGQQTDFARLFSTKENEFGLPPGYLAKTAQVESGGNPGARNPNSSAAGLFQFIKPTAQQYGLQNPMDPVASTDAAARLAADNKRSLMQALGREPTAGELYLAHQQGANGAVKLLANADAPAEAVVGPEAFRLNGGQPGMTAGQFAQRWTSKIDGPRQQGGVASISGDDPVKLRQEAARYAQSSPEAARQFMARAEAAERAQGGVQMAQAQGGPQADMPAQGGAEAQGFAVPGGAQPVNRQNIDVQQLKWLIQAGGEARKLGLALFQQAQTGKNFGFMTGQDGAIYRTNDRTGALERVTEAMKPPVAVSEGQALVDPRTGQVIYQGKEKERAPVNVGEGQSLIDPRTGKVVYQGPVGGKQQQEIAARERIADERGLQGDDRKAFVFNGKIPSQAEKAPTEGQSNAALYAQRMKEAESILENPSVAAASADRMQRGFSQVPVLGNNLVSADYQRAEQAQRNFINATLRRESGAVISEAEFENARKQYFPQPGDGPSVLADKKQNRLTAIQGIENAAGPQYAKRQQQPQQGQVKEGARARNAEGVTIVLRNGQWVRE